MDTVTSKFSKYDEVTVDSSKHIFYIHDCRWNVRYEMLEYSLASHIIARFDSGYPMELVMYDGWYLEKYLTLVATNKYSYQPWDRDKEPNRFVQWFHNLEYDNRVFKMWSKSWLNKKWPCWLQRLYLIGIPLGLPIIQILILIAITIAMMMVYLVSMLAVTAIHIKRWFVSWWKCSY